MRYRELIKTFKVVNGSLDEVLSKKRNLWLGVSVYRKPFSNKFSEQYLKFLCDYTNADFVPILIADTLAAKNICVLNRKVSLDRALTMSIKKGDEIINYYESVISELPLEHRQKIRFVRWDEAITDDIERQKEILKKEYENNPIFKELVHEPILFFLDMIGRSITENRLEELSDYILSEMPFFIGGLRFGHTLFDTELYTTYSRNVLSESIAKLFTDKRYKSLISKLEIEKPQILIDSYIPKKYHLS